MIQKKILISVNPYKSRVISNAEYLGVGSTYTQSGLP